MKSNLSIYLKKGSNYDLYFFQYHQGHWKIVEKIRRLPGITVFL